MKIAITGHQNLISDEVTTWIKIQMQKELIENNIELGFSCLATGTDQLFADIIIRMAIPLTAIIPSNNYESTFVNNKDLNNYNNFLKMASEIIQLDYAQPSEAAFYNASKLMVDECQILLAVWNNLPAQGLGGTADVVAYAKSKHKNIIHLNLITQTINRY